MTGPGTAQARPRGSIVPLCNPGTAISAAPTKITMTHSSADRAHLLLEEEPLDAEGHLACEEAGITVTLPKPMTSNAKADGRFGKQDFRYMAGEDLYISPAGESLTYRYTNEENGLVLRRYWTNACPSCAIKHSCTPSKERRITRWEHEHVLARRAPGKNAPAAR